jgi:hypothetical protein
LVSEQYIAYSINYQSRTLKVSARSAGTGCLRLRYASNGDFREPEPVPNSRVPMQPSDMAGTRHKRDRDGYRRLPRGRETPR